MAKTENEVQNGDVRAPAVLHCADSSTRSCERQPEFFSETLPSSFNHFAVENLVQADAVELADGLALLI